MCPGGRFLDDSAGSVAVTVNADGPTTVTATINGTQRQTANILGGQAVHQFDLPNINPETVKTVVVTGTDSPQEMGGACIVAGSPTN